MNPPPARLLGLAARAARGEWRRGELTLLALALILAVTSITAVGALADRVELLLGRQASELLAADLLIEGPRPVPDAWDRRAREQGLKTAHTTAFPTVVFAGERSHLVAVKAVGPGYPLRGQLKTAQDPFGPPRTTRAIPTPGTTWVAPTVLSDLGLHIGDPLELGETTVKITRLLRFEPDRGGNLLRLAPRVLIHRHDLPATGLLGTGSRARYGLLVAGPALAVERLRDELSPLVGDDFRLHGLRNARPALRSTLDRAVAVLSLAGLITNLLAAVTLALTLTRFVARHRASTALLRCLGANRFTAVAIPALELLFVALPAALIGVALGWITQWGLTQILGVVLPSDLPAPSLWPLVDGLLMGLVVSLVFALPGLLQLASTAPARVLRAAPPILPRWNRLLHLLAWGLLLLVLFRAGGATPLSGYLLAGIAITLAGLWLLSRGLVALSHLLGRFGGPAWRFGLARLSRRGALSSIQMSGLSLTLLALLLFGLIGSNLLSSWLNSLPPETPNRFLINVQPKQAGPLGDWLHQQGLDAAALYPMVRGRLVAINGRNVQPEDFPEGRPRRLARREFNLSHSNTLPAGNRILAGQWWPPGAPPQLSVEQGLAQALGLKLGDRLRFRIAGQDYEAAIHSLRGVEWGSFRPNFFVLSPPSWLASAPATYITSFYLPAGRGALMARLVHRFPGVAVLDVDDLMNQVRGLLARISRALLLLFLFSLAAGLLTIVAAVAQDREQRVREVAILRTLGASRRLIRRSLLTEFLVLGLGAGLLASLAATGISERIATQILDIPYHWDAQVWLVGMFSGLLAPLLVGSGSIAPILRTPPMEVLRSGSE